MMPRTDFVMNRRVASLSERHQPMPVTCHAVKRSRHNDEASDEPMTHRKAQSLSIAIAAIPCHKGAQAIFDRRPRRKAGVTRQFGAVGKGFENVDGAHRQQFALGALADELFQNVEQSIDFDRMLVADIIETVRRPCRGPPRLYK